MKTSLPTALVFGFDQIGEVTLQSDVYFEEGLIEDVNLICYDSTNKIHHLISKHTPDIIITIGSKFKDYLDSVCGKLNTFTMTYNLLVIL